jgi:predicted transcriptional regulator
MEKIKELEKRIKKLECEVFKTSKKASRKKGEKALISDLDSLMQNSYSKGGIIFSGVAIPSDSEDRFIRWSTSGAFDCINDINRFIDQTPIDAVFEFCQSFSSREKLQIIKSLIKNESLNQKEIVKISNITQGKFYHHVKDLLANKLVKNKDGCYSLTPMGHVLAMSLIGLTNAFVKKVGAD